MKRPVDIRLAVAVRSLQERLPEVSTERLIRAAMAVLQPHDPYKRLTFSAWMAPLGIIAALPTAYTAFADMKGAGR